MPPRLTRQDAADRCRRNAEQPRYGDALHVGGVHYQDAANVALGQHGAAVPLALRGVRRRASSRMGRAARARRNVQTRRAAVAGRTTGATLADHVGDVLGAGALAQVRRSDAGAIVAPMQAARRRPMTVRQQEREAMCTPGRAIKREPTVPVEQRAGPNPACAEVRAVQRHRAAPIDARPKTGDIFPVHGILSSCGPQPPIVASDAGANL